MKKIILLTVSVMFAASAFGQAPDNDAIRAAIFDPASKYFYERLYSRYERGDTTLTREDYRHLYYGFAYNEAYKPLETAPEEAQILMILEKHPESDPALAADIISYGRRVMKHDPFSPHNINFMTYAYGLLGDAENERISAARLAGIMDAIASSGTGLSEDSPWHVLAFSHVNDFLASRGYEIRKRTVVSSTVEYVAVKDPENKVKGVYFDYGRAFWNLPANMPDKRGGLKFGNSKPRYTSGQR